MNNAKYHPFPPVNLENRQWPGRVITKAPIWCSVDLRDGNQALEVPMNLAQKINFFKFLIKLGFKEIEIGFPAASDTEFAFTRVLIEENLIPDDVAIQVLTQAREHVIERTFQALEGTKKAIVHVYNSTSTLQREVVFQKSRREIIALAVDAAKQIHELAKKYGRERFIFEYSPESFTGTELDFATEICNEVLEVWQPDAANKAIINLPSTVEMSTPNIFADQIEYMCANIVNRENVIISIHPHNDRGTATAAAELGLMAGADRLEGTLFGNGERTGNVDIMNVALNLYSQGIDPEMDFSDINSIIDIYEKSTGLLVHPRHPYAGALVFTAFSGSHQDAIRKGMAKMETHPGYWGVPYLPIDPTDLGCSYDPIIRINSQSGKSGVSYILEHNFGLHLPKLMQQDFGNMVTKISDGRRKELSPPEIYELFKAEYINIVEPVALVWYDEETTAGSLKGESFWKKNPEPQKNGASKGEMADMHSEAVNGNGIIDTYVTATMMIKGEKREISGSGNGLLDGFCKALSQEMNLKFEIVRYNEHSLDYGTKSRAITYIQIVSGEKHYFGAGMSGNISKSSIRAVVSAVNKMLTQN